ncbi:MAG TPA: PD-(D/E)XK nuclease family protein [Sphingobacteriaceae bacterium]
MRSFLHEVATDLTARFGDGLKDVAIVFNNKRPVLFLKKHLGETAGRSSWSPAFFTVGEFFARSSDKLVADQIRQFFILHQEFNKLLKAEGKTAFTPDQFYPVAEIILNDFAQIDYDLVDPDELFCELEDIAVIAKQFPHFSAEQHKFLEQFWGSFSEEKQQEHQQKFIDLWKRMPKLYKAFHEQLTSLGTSTTAHLYRQLATGNAASPNFTDPYTKLVFVGFNALNKCESRLFKKWQDEGRALFYFDTDTYYTDDELQEAGLFLRRNLTKTDLQNALGASPARIKDRQTQIRVIETQGYTSQAKAINEFIRPEEFLRSDDPEQTAIIIADETLLVPVLQTIAPEAGKVNVTMGYPLAQSTVFGLIELWLHVQEQVHKENKGTINYRDVQAFLSHPLSGVTERERDILQKRMLDNQWLEVPLPELLFSSALAPNFFTVKHDGLQCIDALYVLLTAVLEQRQKNGRLQQLEANLLMAVSKNLNLLYDGLAEYAVNLPLTFVLALIRKTLQGLSVPLEGEPLRGIQVMGLLESRCLDFEKVIILGVNEGTIPKLSVSPSFIPDSIRRAYGLPVLENQDAISAYLFYRLLQRPADVSVTYNSLVDESNSGEPSRFLRQLEFESNFRFEYHRQSQPVRIEPRQNLVIPKTGKVWSALQRFLQATGKWNDEKISATALTTYLNCSLQFFFRYVAKIKEPEEVAENLEANQIGSVLHQVMEWFYQELVNEDPNITATRIRAKRKDIPSLCRSALSHVLFGNKGQLRHPNSMQTIVLRIVEEYAEAILLHDENIAPFRISELENNKDYKYRFPIDVNGSRHEVLLYGIIDRVDVKDGTTRIVDYKTGGRDEVKFSSLDEVFERDGKKPNKALMQTLFYTFIYEQVKGLKHVEPNLYIIRKMKDDGTLFYTGGRSSGKVLLQAEHLEEQKTDFRAKLSTLLEELFDRDTPFTETGKKENCGFCPYKEMCQK